MKVLNIASDLVLTTDGNSTAVDLAAAARRVPFLANNTVVAAISLNVAADAVITIQGSDSSDFSSGVNTLAQVDLTAGGPKSGTVFKEITLAYQYIRVNANEVTTGAGSVDVDLLGN